MTPLNLNHQAIVERGGDIHGDYVLLRCPTCAALALYDLEHDLLHPDLADLTRCVPLSLPGDRGPCEACGASFIVDAIWAAARTGHDGTLFPTLDAVRGAAADWLLAEAARGAG